MVFAPVLLMVLGAVMGNTPRANLVQRIFALAGVVGCLLLCGFNLWAIGVLWKRPFDALTRLHAAGIGCGLLAVWLYARDFRQARAAI